MKGFWKGFQLPCLGYRGNHGKVVTLFITVNIPRDVFFLKNFNICMDKTLGLKSFFGLFRFLFL